MWWSDDTFPWGGTWRNCKLEGRRRGFRHLQAILSSTHLLNQTIPGSYIALERLLPAARLVNNKTVLIHELVVDEQTDLACITETWLDDMGGVKKMSPDLKELSNDKPVSKLLFLAKLFKYAVAS